jgi:hypothetical protein
MEKSRCDKPLESMQAQRENYDNAQRVHMMSSFQQIPPSLWEKYLDELHPLIKEAKKKSAEALPQVPLPQVPVPQVPLPQVPLPQVPLPLPRVPQMPLPQVPLPLRRVPQMRWLAVRVVM